MNGYEFSAVCIVLALILAAIFAIISRWLWVIQLGGDILAAHVVIFIIVVPCLALVWITSRVYVDIAVKLLVVEQERGKVALVLQEYSRTPSAIATVTNHALRYSLPNAPIELKQLLGNVRALVIGQTGSGKSTLLRWIATERSRMGHQVFVIDPHGTQYDWGVIPRGSGRNFEDISQGLKDLKQILHKRFEDRKNGKRSFNHICVILDEWRLITLNVEDAKNVIRVLLTEGRKVEMSVILAGHSDRAESLGLKGEYDLVDGFLFVWMAGIGRAELSYGRKNERYQVMIPPIVDTTLSLPNTTNTTLDTSPNTTENTVRNLVKKGWSANKIYSEIGGNRNEVMRLVRELKADMV